MPRISDLPSAAIANPPDILPGDQAGVTKTFTVQQLRFGAWVSAVDGPAIPFNLALGNRQEVTLGGNRALAVLGDADGQAFVIALTQDGTGGRTVTWWSGIRWAGGAVPVLTTSPGSLDLFTFLRLAPGAYLGVAALNFA